jgi:hypothetical protein
VCAGGVWRAHGECEAVARRGRGTRIAQDTGPKGDAQLAPDNRVRGGQGRGGGRGDGREQWVAPVYKMS